MKCNTILFRAITLIVCLWSCVAVFRFVASSKVATAENFAEQIQRSEFDNFADSEKELSPEIRKEREEKLAKLASVLNRMSFQEREKLRQNRIDARFFDKLTEREKALWIDLTLKQSMDKMMVALDAMPAEDRRQFVEKGLAELERGFQGEDLERMQSVDSDLIEKITKEGLRSFYEKAGSQTKMDLAPLMESMHEVMQGLRGQQFGAQS